MGRIVVYWYRAMCFGKPIGPWRQGLRAARADLVSANLGSYEPDGFFITVPGSLDCQSEWMDFDEAISARVSTTQRVLAR